MTRLLPYLDRIIDAGLIFLVVFTPLAFGTVEIWSQAIAQFVIVVVFAAWLLKVIWGPRPLVIHLEADGAHGHASEGGRRRWRGMFGGRVVLSGLEWLAILFAVLVVAQMVPLPLAWLDAVQPRTAAMVRSSMPVAGSTHGPVTTRQFESWLLSQEHPAPTTDGRRLPVGKNDQDSSLVDQPLGFNASSRHSLSLSAGTTRRRLEVYLAYLAVFLVGVNHWRDRRHADRIVTAIAVSGGLIALLGVLQRLTLPDRLLWMRPVGADRLPFGPFVNHNHFAGYMEMVIPVALGLGLVVYEQARLSRDASTKVLELGRHVVPRILLALTAATFGGIALLASRSRGGLLAALASAALFLMLAPFRRGPWFRRAVVGLLIAAATVGVAARVGGDDLWEHYASMASPGGEPSFAFRLETTRNTLDMFTDYPVVGVGLGVFQDIYPAYAAGSSSRRTGAAHDDYVQLLAETGLLGGLLAAIAGLLFLFRFLLPGLARVGSPRRHLVHGVAVGCLAIAVHSAYDFNLQVYSNGLLFVILAAVLAADRIARTPRQVPAR